MKPAFVVVGVSILILGGALIFVGPFLTTSAFYREEANIIRQGSSSSPNLNSTYSALTNAVNQAATVVILGVILAPVGGGILAYGLITNKSQDAIRNQAESSVPARPS